MLRRAVEERTSQGWSVADEEVPYRRLQEVGNSTEQWTDNQTMTTIPRTRRNTPAKRAGLKQDELQVRRDRAWSLRMDGKKSYREIAQELGISLQTVFADLEFARKEVRQDSREYAAEEKARDLADIEFLRSELIKEATAPPPKPSKNNAKVARESITKVASAYAALSARKAKLLGLDAPSKTELTGPGGGPLVSAGEGWEKRLIDLG